MTHSRFGLAAVPHAKPAGTRAGLHESPRLAIPPGVAFFLRTRSTVNFTLARFIALLLAPLSVVHAAWALSARPNIVYIIADDLGYGEPGCYGGKDIPTPHIDALAAGGTRFTSGYVTAPFCAASRAALMTGRYQTRFGFEFNPIGAKNAAPGIGLPVAEKTVADRLRDAGYATALVGKWHLGGTAEFHPQRRGRVCARFWHGLRLAGADGFYSAFHNSHGGDEARRPARSILAESVRPRIIGLRRPRVRACLILESASP